MNGKVPLLGSGMSRLHAHRVVVDGEVREVVTNLTAEDMVRFGLGVSYLVRLARDYGRPVQDGAA